MNETERIEELEKLCRDLMGWVCCLQLGGRMPTAEYVELEMRMLALGMET